MDKLFEAASYYQNNLLNKTFHIKAEKRNKTLEFEITFGEEYFKHLAGLQYVSDVIQKHVTSKTIIKDILSGNLKNEDIEKSSGYEKMRNRIENFTLICDLLFAKEILCQSLHGIFRTINADILINKEYEGIGIAQLFLKNKKEGISIPISFFVSDKDIYSLGTVKWKVVEVYEVK